MKRVLGIFIGLLFMFTMVSCVKDKPNRNDKLDDNGTQNVDKDDRIDADLDPNYTDGLN